MGMYMRKRSKDFKITRTERQGKRERQREKGNQGRGGKTEDGGEV